MSLVFSSWLVVFALQSALLGKSLHTLVALSDLQNDKINPFDCAAQINRSVLLEFTCQALLTGVLLLTGSWAAAALHVAVSCYLAHMSLSKQVHMHAADAFRQLASFKQRRLTVFIAYCVSFVLITYRLIQVGLVVLLSIDGS